MTRLCQYILRRLLESNIPERKKTDAKIALAFAEWLATKGYLTAVSEEEVARGFGVSTAQLSSFCRVRMGCSFRQLRKEYRIREAKMLLRVNPELPLDVIGESVGIPDKSNFRKQFLDVVGCSPREWVDGRKKRLL